MNREEQKRFEPLYEQMQQELVLQGKRAKTIEAYSRAIRRASAFFDRCPDDLKPYEIKDYFASLVKSHSWSTVKLDRCGIQFFYRHVLNKPWNWVKIVKPPVVRTLPDILTREETFEVINNTRKLRYRVFFLTVYSMGLRLGEGLQLEVGDIDGNRRRVHIRKAKGGRDRYVAMPEVTLDALRRFWSTHRNSRFLFPNTRGSAWQMRTAMNSMDRGGVQAAMKAAVADTGIHRNITLHSLRHGYATHLLELGVDLLDIQKSLGHALLKTTANYVQLTDVIRKDAIEQLEHMFESFSIRWTDAK